MLSEQATVLPGFARGQAVVIFHYKTSGGFDLYLTHINLVIDQRRMMPPISNTRQGSHAFGAFSLPWLLAGTLLLGVASCKKQPDQAGTSSTQATATDAVDPTVELTQALRKYAIEHRAMPKTFAELVAAGYVKNPPAAPAGKKFEIDPKTGRIVLVNQ